MARTGRPRTAKWYQQPRRDTATPMERVFEQVERICAEQRKRILYNLHSTEAPSQRSLRDIDALSEALESEHRKMRLGPALHFREDDLEIEVHDWRH